MWPILKHLPEQDHPDLLIGYNQADDSGVMRLDDDRAIVFTVDFFPAIVDDPYIFGQVAAANAMSDVYAMGGRPLSALNIVGFPVKDLPIDLLEDVLRGGAEKVNEAGAVVVGGHTIKDSELKYGLAVVGLVDPRRILRINGARPGDRLVLTKPIGTGIYSTALKKEELSGAQEKLFYDVMTTLNRAASEELGNHQASACTDVTGFGLLGHSLEMAEESDVTVAIDAASVPKLDGVLDLAGRGFLTGGGMANREYAAGKLRFESDPSTELEMLLYDAQTSGGLLVSLPAGKADSYVTKIHAAGVSGAAIIGEVHEPADVRIIVNV
ncbi:MAG: selenide, water dikinase SelD [bacterium]|nr:MAG: selenide, water dikinase SelD [bacterium]